MKIFTSDLIIKQDHPLILTEIYSDTHADIIDTDTIIKDKEEDVGPGRVNEKIQAVSNKSQEDKTEDGGKKESKVKEQIKCANCDCVYKDNNDLNIHIKSNHKDYFINLLEKRLNVSEKTLELVEIEKKQYADQVQKLVKDIEKLMVEHKELSVLKTVKKTQIMKSPGDKYDQEDVIKLDSEKEILNGKRSGFRRDGPQVQSTPINICPECQKILRDKVKFQEHMKQHDALKIKCRICTKTFNNDNDLNFHTIYEHKVQSQWNCMDCSFQTDNKELLRNHVTFKHTREDMQVVFPCDECEMKYTSKWSLNNHKRDAHGPQEE